MRPGARRNGRIAKIASARQRQHQERVLKRHDRQQTLDRERPRDLAERARRGGDAQRQGSVLFRGRAADHRQNHPEPGARDPEADQHVDRLMPARRHRPRRQRQPARIDQRPEDQRAAVPEPLCDRGEDRLAEAPCKVLDRDGHGVVGAGPAEFRRDGDLEQAEARPDAERQDHDCAARDENRGDQG
jgi:hypothetical protein